MDTPTPRRTRIAPTPSGFLHLGNAYSFLLTQALARQNGAQILLRIDDMDRDRVRPDYIRDIFATLAFLGIDYSQGPRDPDDFERHFSQRHRLPLYQTVLQRLIATGRVYACGCSRSQLAAQGGHSREQCPARHLPLDTPDLAWRIATDERPLRVRDEGGNSVTATLPSEQIDFIIRKRDGFPAYQVTSLADDLHFGIGLIVRGQDLWDSTLCQLFLATLLEEASFLDTAFHHHRLIRDESERKLSKSDGSTSVAFLRKKGLSRDDVLALLPPIIL